VPQAIRSDREAICFAAIAHSRFWHEREVPARTANIG
jgi:hypothetical protein